MGRRERVTATTKTTRNDALEASGRQERPTDGCFLLSRSFFPSGLMRKAGTSGGRGISSSSSSSSSSN